MGVALFYLVSPLRSAQFADWARGGRLFRDSLTGSTPSNAINMVAFTQDNNAFDASNSLQFIGSCDTGHMEFDNFDTLYKKPDGSFSLVREFLLGDGSKGQVKSIDIDTLEALNWLLHEHPRGQALINQHFSEIIKGNELEEFIMSWYAPPDIG